MGRQLPKTTFTQFLLELLWTLPLRLVLTLQGFIFGSARGFATRTDLHLTQVPRGKKIAKIGFFLVLVSQPKISSENGAAKGFIALSGHLVPKYLLLTV